MGHLNFHNNSQRVDCTAFSSYSQVFQDGLLPCSFPYFPAKSTKSLGHPIFHKIPGNYSLHVLTTTCWPVFPFTYSLLAYTVKSTEVQTVGKLRTRGTTN